MNDGEKEGRSGDERRCRCHGAQRRTSARQIFNSEAPQGNRVRSGQGSVGGQRRDESQDVN